MVGINSILAVVQKGLSVISALTAAEKKIEPALKIVWDLVNNAQTDDVSEEQLKQAEATLDTMIDEFNEPI